MNISNVTRSSNLGANTKHDSVVDALQRQKAELTKQIEEVKGSKQDSKTKADKINEITTQIAEIDQQIAQAQLDAKQKEMQEAQEKNAEKAEIERYEQETEENNPGVILSPSLTNLLAANKSSSDYKTMHNVRRKLLGQMAVGQREDADVSSVSGKIVKLENDMMKKTEEVHHHLQKSVKLGIKEADKARESKDAIKKDHEEATDVSKGDTTGDVTTEKMATPTTTDKRDSDRDTEIQKDKSDNKELDSVDVKI